MTNKVIQDDIEAEEVEQDQYLVFTTQSQEFGIQVTQVQEITSVLGTTDIPNSPPYVEGIMNLKGQLATVINFRKKLGFEPKEHDEDTRVIIVEQAGFPVGIIVDSVEEVIKIPDDLVHKLPESTSLSAAEETMKGVGMLDQRLVILLDVDKLLAETQLSEQSAIRQAIDNVQTVEKSHKAETEAQAAATSPTIDDAQSMETVEESESMETEAAQHSGEKRKPTVKREGE